MKTPVHLWLVGIVMLIWNGMGAMDYVLTVSRSESYLEQFTPERLAFLEAFPGWAVGSWALAVWLYVLGSILLLFRSRFAPPVLIAGFVFMLVTTFHNLVLAEVSPVETMSTGEGLFTIGIFVLALLQIVYGRAMLQRNVLR